MARAVSAGAAGRRLIFLSRCLAGIHLAAAAAEEVAVDRESEKEKMSFTG